MERVRIGVVEIEYDAGNVRIVESWRVNNRKAMRCILEYFREKTGYKSRRSIGSWVREWKAHNRMYRIGWFESHTRDCDLEELESWYRRVVYWFIGR